MNATWQVQQAKNRFSEMIEQALSSGPQVITRHGRIVAQVVAAKPMAASPAANGLGEAALADGFAQYLLDVPKADGFVLPLRRSRKVNLRLGH